MIWNQESCSMGTGFENQYEMHTFLEKLEQLDNIIPNKDRSLKRPVTEEIKLLTQNQT